MSKFILFIFTLLCIQLSYAQRGKQGDVSISNKKSIVNEFTIPLENIKKGDVSITVKDIAINTHQRFKNPLSKGDLLMIIQMQGAIINADEDSLSYGDIIDYKNCGNWEFQEVASIQSDTIKLKNKTKHNYDIDGKVQIIRVPRFKNLILKEIATLTTEGWNGTYGGVLAIEVEQDLVIRNKARITATGLGFRGGRTNTAAQFQATELVRHNIVTYRSFSPFHGAEKGEGVAGWYKEYNHLYNGKYGRGAAANAGGGGNSHNAGGGGGANAGLIMDWTGNGNPDISEEKWKKAWALEKSLTPYSISSGGGRGGYSFSFRRSNSQKKGPGEKAWAGDQRQNVGGLGGRPLDYSSGKLFLGGGGGAGDSNNFNGTAGGNGGGIVYILCHRNIYGARNGLSLIEANGNDALTTTINKSNFGHRAGDAPGGGGGGGVIVLDNKGIMEHIISTANGGSGGSQMIIFMAEAEGPGGGGGGGYIAANNTYSSVVLETYGGLNGITNANGHKDFLPNGATFGGIGVIAQISNYSYTSPQEIQGADKLVFSKKKEVSFEHVEENEIHILFNMYFERRSDRITKVSNEILDKLVAHLKENNKIYIHFKNYCNEYDSEEDNKKMSIKRGKSLVQFLAKNKINETRISYEGLGSNSTSKSSSSNLGNENTHTEYILGNSSYRNAKEGK